MLRELCQKHTDLNNDDILELENYANKLKTFSELTETDLFIDCLLPNSSYAVVVYQQGPPSGSTLFKSSVTGVIIGMDTEPAVIRTLKTGITSKKLKAMTQENKMVQETVVPIQNSSGKIIGVLVSEHDVTEQVNQNKHIKVLEHTQRKLIDNLEHIRNNPEIITEHINQSVIIFDHKGLVVYVNPEAKILYSKLGYIDDIQKLNMENLTLDKRDYCLLKENRNDFKNEIHIGELTLSIRYLCLKIASSDCTVMLISDLSEIRNKEKELILKSVAVKEIHHRVKNNLQTIASILSMQARRINDEEMKKILNENTLFLDSIAATHEILAERGFEKIDIKELIKKISSMILDHSLVDTKKIMVETKGDSVFMDSDKVSGVMLVINELLSNSIEHGFNHKTEGNIEITINNNDPFSIFTIKDNGCGFSKGSNFESLGLNIVKAIIKDKLSGKLQIHTDDSGTKIEFSVKN